ncbi:MAG: sulfur carrier protein ThiS [Desulfovibrionaceae bacterium]|nr:sulfur carrier protein ThiS [Desulfovibrionaceae bacterium]
MIVVLNGKEIEAVPGTTIADLLAQREIASETVVAERNGDIVPGADFSTVALKDGDHLEILRFVGGG